LLQVARQPTEKKMIEMFHRIMQGGLTRDEARRERREEHAGPQAATAGSFFNSSLRRKPSRSGFSSKRATFRAMN